MSWGSRHALTFQVSARHTPIKKENLDIGSKNFRQISNLSFLSKILERIVIDQLSQHCDNHELNEKNEDRVAHW